MNTQNKSRNEADEAQQRGGRERNRGNLDQLDETVEQFGAAIDAHVYRQLERLTRDDEQQQRPIVHTKRDRRWS